MFDISLGELVPPVMISQDRENINVFNLRSLKSIEDEKKAAVAEADRRKREEEERRRKRRERGRGRRRRRRRKEKGERLIRP